VAAATSKHKDKYGGRGRPAASNVIPLAGRSVAIERNILTVPMFVLHAKAAKSLSQLVYTWKPKDALKAVFRFSRTGEDAFPLTQHALYLDIMLGMFAANFREDRLLYFRYSDILRAAGKNPHSQGARRALKEAIKRYFRCHVAWEYSYKGREDSWSGSIIEGTSLFNEEAINPRNAATCDDDDKEAWHFVRLNQYITDSIKDGHTRIFLTKILRMGLKHDSFCVYRYWYGFTDQSIVKRSLDQLRAAFPWTGRRDRFVHWLDKRLAELLRRGLIEHYSITEGLVCVKCTPLADIEQETKGKAVLVDHDVPADAKLVSPVAPDSKTRRLRTTINKLPAPALLEKYFELKAAGDVSPAIAGTLDRLIADRQSDIYIPALRSYLSQHR